MKMDYNKFDKIEHSDSDESIDQMEQIRNANIKPGMFVSGWEDPNDEVYPETDPHGSLQKEILWAVDEGKADLVENILKRDKSCRDAVDEDGYTPLHRACYNNQVEIAKILLKYGANVHAKTAFGWTPLHSAVKWSNAECAALMLQHGADVNAISDGSQTPLHIAATISNCRETAMTLMMEPDCNTALLNNSNETAADIAKRTGLSFELFEMGNSEFSVDTGLID